MVSASKLSMADLSAAKTAAQKLAGELIHPITEVGTYDEFINLRDKHDKKQVRESPFNIVGVGIATEDGKPYLRVNVRRLPMCFNEIGKEYEGFRVRVTKTGLFSPTGSRVNAKPSPIMGPGVVLMGGLSLSPSPLGSTGALGFMAKCSKSGRPGLVSPEHVLRPYGQAGAGGWNIVHPGIGDHRCGAVVAEYVRDCGMLLNLSKGRPVDAAFAEVRDVAWEPSIRGAGRITGRHTEILQLGQRVLICGRQSGERQAEVTQVGLAVAVPFKHSNALRRVEFANIVTVKETNIPQLGQGDSGAPVYCRLGKDVLLVGMMFATARATREHAIILLSDIEASLDVTMIGP
ncbi:MAG TPA: hypothetical protein VFE62_29160 [Gemmataceae bacterium]|nr:hypothetical protein [Gemmataceae bacterium]